MRLRYLAICAWGFFMFGTSAFAVKVNQAQGNEAAVKKTSSSAKLEVKGMEKIIAGPVASINVGKNQITVERNGKLYPISIDGSTQIVGKNNPIALEKIKAGDLVSISYHKASDGRRIALNINNRSFSAPVTPKQSPQTKAEPKKEPAATKAEAKAEATVTPKVEVKAEPKKEPVAAAKAEIKADSKKEPAAMTKIEPSSAPKAEVKAEPKKEPTAATKAEPKKEPIAVQ